MHSNHLVLSVVAKYADLAAASGVSSSKFRSALQDVPGVARLAEPEQMLPSEEYSLVCRAVIAAALEDCSLLSVSVYANAAMSLYLDVKTDRSFDGAGADLIIAQLKSELAAVEELCDVIREDAEERGFSVIEV